MIPEASEESIIFISNLLDINPKHRPTAIQALDLPYLQDADILCDYTNYYNNIQYNTQSNGGYKVNPKLFEFENQKCTLNQLKDEIHSEVFSTTQRPIPSPLEASEDVTSGEYKGSNNNRDENRSEFRGETRDNNRGEYGIYNRDSNREALDMSNTMITSENDDRERERNRTITNGGIYDYTNNNNNSNSNSNNGVNMSSKQPPTAPSGFKQNYHNTTSERIEYLRKLDNAQQGGTTITHSDPHPYQQHGISEYKHDELGLGQGQQGHIRQQRGQENGQNYGHDSPAGDSAYDGSIPTTTHTNNSEQSTISYGGKGGGGGMMYNNNEFLPSHITASSSSLQPYNDTNMSAKVKPTFPLTNVYNSAEGRSSKSSGNTHDSGYISSATPSSIAPSSTATPSITPSSNRGVNVYSRSHMRSQMTPRSAALADAQAQEEEDGFLTARSSNGIADIRDMSGHDALATRVTLSGKGLITSAGSSKIFGPGHPSSAHGNSSSLMNDSDLTINSIRSLSDNHLLTSLDRVIPTPTELFPVQEEAESSVGGGGGGGGGYGGRSGDDISESKEKDKDDKYGYIDRVPRPVSMRKDDSSSTSSYKSGIDQSTTTKTGVKGETEDEAAARRNSSSGGKRDSITRNLFQTLRSTWSTTAEPIEPSSEMDSATTSHSNSKTNKDNHSKMIAHPPSQPSSTPLPVLSRPSLRNVFASLTLSSGSSTRAPAKTTTGTHHTTGNEKKEALYTPTNTILSTTSSTLHERKHTHTHSAIHSPIAPPTSTPYDPTPPLTSNTSAHKPSPRTQSHSSKQLPQSAVVNNMTRTPDSTVHSSNMYTSPKKSSNLMQQQPTYHSDYMHSDNHPDQYSSAVDNMSITGDSGGGGGRRRKVPLDRVELPKLPLGHVAFGASDGLNVGSSKSTSSSRGSGEGSEKRRLVESISIKGEPWPQASSLKGFPDIPQDTPATSARSLKPLGEHTTATPRSNSRSKRHIPSSSPGLNSNLLLPVSARPLSLLERDVPLQSGASLTDSISEKRRVLHRGDNDNNSSNINNTMNSLSGKGLLKH